MRRSKWMIRFTIGLIAPMLGIVGVHSVNADTANYDTAWSFTYDGGIAKNGLVIEDQFADVKILPNGEALLAGETKDSGYFRQALLVRMSPAGAVKQTKALKLVAAISAGSLLLRRNGEIWVGGEKFGAPLLMRFDESLNLISSYWHYDSVNESSKLLRPASLQSLVETADDRVIAVGGDEFPYNRSRTLNNYAVWMEFDSSGILQSRAREWINETPYELAGWSIVETDLGDLMIGGNAAVAYMKGNGDENSKVRYSFSLTGVGTVINKVFRVRKLRGGNLIAIGQAYEEDCWTRYNRLSYDGWWSFLSPSGANDSWNTAGVSGVHDVVFDAAQLTDGRIAFIGVKGSSPDSGAWMFVTDSTAKTIQWQRQFNLPGMDAGLVRNNLIPYSVAATPDSGFMVVGKEGATNLNDNGFAFKVVPKSMPVTTLSFGLVKKLRAIGKPSIIFETTETGNIELKVFNLRGQLIQNEIKILPKPGSVSFILDSKINNNGLILWELRTSSQYIHGKYLMRKP